MKAVVDPLLARWVPYPVRGPAADLGAGAGGCALYLAEHGFRVVALDRDPTGAASCQEQAGKRGLTLWACAGDLAALPFPPGVFHFLCVRYVLHGFPKQRVEEVLEALAARLGRGGRLYLAALTNQDPLYLRWLAQPALERGPEPAFFAPGELLRLAEKALTILYYREEKIDEEAHHLEPQPHSHVIAHLVAESAAEGGGGGMRAGAEDLKK